MRIRPNSLRVRLVAAALLATSLFSAAFAGLAIWRTDSLEDRAVESALKARLSVVSNGVGFDGSLALSGSGNPRAAYSQVVGPSGKVLDASPPLTRAPALLQPTTVARKGAEQRVHEVNLSDPDIDLAVIGAPVHLRGGTGAVIVGVETQGFLSARREVLTLCAIGLACATALVGVITWLLTGRALTTVGRLTSQAEKLSVSNATHSLQAPRQDRELAELTDALNRMLARLGEHHARNLAAAAETTHRLRTPLATLRAEAELALTENDPALMRDALRSVVDDADRLGAVIDRLLRIGSSGSLPQPVHTVVADLGDVWDRQARAAGASLELHTSGTGDIDAQLLRAVVEPLLENALAYAERGSPLTIDVRANEQLDVVVENLGDGVAEDVRGILFEPWVSGARGRSGLGLWLARETAREAGGDVTCDSYGPRLTRFSARLPLS